MVFTEELQNDNLVSIHHQVLHSNICPSHEYLSCHNPWNTLAHYSSCLVHYQGIRRSAMVDCLMKHGAKPLLNLDPTKLFRLCAGQGVLPLVQQVIEMKQVNPIPN